MCELVFGEANAAGFIAGCDLVLDGTDRFETRLAVGAACVAAGVPLVSGAIGRWTGQVGVFAGRPCYRCLVPEIPPDAETCSVVGVVGALAGVVGAMMALEAIKLIAGAGEPLAGRLLVYDALSAETRTRPALPPIRPARCVGEARSAGVSPATALASETPAVRGSPQNTSPGGRGRGPCEAWEGEGLGKEAA